MAGSGLIAPPLTTFLRVDHTTHVHRREAPKCRQDADGGQGHRRAPNACEAEDRLLAPPAPTLTISGSWTLHALTSLLYACPRPVGSERNHDARVMCFSVPGSLRSTLITVRLANKP